MIVSLSLVLPSPSGSDPTHQPHPQALPPLTTSPVLVLVGAMMMGEASHLDWTRMTSAIPAFLTIVIQPFTFSIANGIYAGMASRQVIRL